MVGHGFSYGQTRFHRNVGSWVERPPLIFRDDSHLWRRFGFQIDGGPDGLTYASFPLWVPVIGSAIPPIIRLVTQLKLRSGSCPSWAYDLTANTTGICPECGQTPIQQQ
jgi:hypothetical protein